MYHTILPLEDAIFRVLCVELIQCDSQFDNSYDRIASELRSFCEPHIHWLAVAIKCVALMQSHAYFMVILV